MSGCVKIVREVNLSVKFDQYQFFVKTRGKLKIPEEAKCKRRETTSPTYINKCFVFKIQGGQNEIACIQNVL